ncbi:MAG: hypothetical protein NC483_01670 [Ruminococcus sp.]|nr:hypothetical protein [Ruminococcus sp.]
MIYKSFFRKKTTKIYVFIITLILTAIFLLVINKNHYIELYNNNYKGSFISVASNKEDLDVIKKIKEVKIIGEGITIDNKIFMVDYNLKDSEVKISDFYSSSDFPDKIISLELENYSKDLDIIGSHEYSSSLFKISNSTMKEIASYGDKTYVLDLKDWTKDYKIRTKISELGEFDISASRKYKSNINYEPTIILTKIFIILSIILFAIILIVTIVNIFEDEKKKVILYRALGQNKKQIAKYSIIKLVLLFVISILLSLLISGIYLIFN